jgi:hypothetical protein
MNAREQQLSETFRNAVVASLSGSSRTIRPALRGSWSERYCVLCTQYVSAAIAAETVAPKDDSDVQAAARRKANAMRLAENTLRSALRLAQQMSEAVGPWTVFEEIAYYGDAGRE